MIVEVAVQVARRVWGPGDPVHRGLVVGELGDRVDGRSDIQHVDRRLVHLYRLQKVSDRQR